MMNPPKRYVSKDWSSFKKYMMANTDAGITSIMTMCFLCITFET